MDFSAVPRYRLTAIKTRAGNYFYHHTHPIPWISVKPTISAVVSIPKHGDSATYSQHPWRQWISRKRIVQCDKWKVWFTPYLCVIIIQYLQVYLRTYMYDRCLARTFTVLVNDCSFDGTWNCLELWSWWYSTFKTLYNGSVTNFASTIQSQSKYR